MYQVITSDFVKVNVTNSQNDAVAFEQKFAKTFSIEELKVMFYHSRCDPFLRFGATYDS